VIFKPTFKRESERRLAVQSNKIKSVMKSIYEELSSDNLNRGYTQN